MATTKSTKNDTSGTTDIIPEGITTTEPEQTTTDGVETPVVEWMDVIKLLEDKKSDKSPHKIAFVGGNIVNSRTEYDLEGHLVGVILSDEPLYIIWTTGEKQSL